MVKREVKVGSSRLDLMVKKGERDLYVEVKGVDLIKGDLALFPDAVTSRGTRHLYELEALVSQDKEAMVIFLVAREDARAFKPNADMDPDFAQAYYQVQEAGVQARAYLSRVGPDYIELAERIPCK